jgi:hypothetical protein
MARPIVDHGRCARFRVRSISNHVEAEITKEEGCAARQTFCLRGIQHFHFNPHAIRGLRIIRHIRDGILISAIERAKPQPPDTAENAEGDNYSAIATSPAPYLKLFQSSTVSGKM